MTNIRRYFAEGQINFLTHVTYNRIPILTDNIDLFWNAYQYSCGKNGADLIAWVILPDHAHLLINPAGNNLPNLMKLFKLKFSGLYRAKHHLLKGRIWQNNVETARVSTYFATLLKRNRIDYCKISIEGSILL